MTDLNSLRYTAEHEWIAFDTASGIATIGVTDFAVANLGDIVFAELPDPGTAVAAGDVCAEIESTKSVGEIYAPLSGTVVEVNEEAVEDPSYISGAPFAEGWLLRLRVDDPAAVEGLLDRAAYAALTGGKG
ncbi:glycine cleavage system protein GcvH [Microbacterium sp.]|uniref:glycine cleavage system protein GcvH n=1 Tax=Microbacterium sp. TaxID=51671 RepID=UPI0039E57483